MQLESWENIVTTCTNYLVAHSVLSMAQFVLSILIRMHSHEETIPSCSQTVIRIVFQSSVFDAISNGLIPNGWEYIPCDSLVTNATRIAVNITTSFHWPRLIHYHTVHLTLPMRQFALCILMQLDYVSTRYLERNTETGQYRTSNLR